MADASRAGVILFDDGGGAFGPLCDLRPFFGLRTGAHTHGERLAAMAGGVHVASFVPQHMVEVVRETGGVPTNALPAGEIFRIVNGRATSVPDVARGEAFVTAQGEVLAAHLDHHAALAFARDRRLPDSVRIHEASADTLFRHPWEILDGLGAAITSDIMALAGRVEALGYATLADPHPARMGARMGVHPVVLHRTASVAPFVVFDASQGPIHVGERAVIRPFSVLCGPCSIGSGSTVADRALIKPNTTCGPQCRLGGEVGGTSIVGFSNKTHDGHLGDSLIGEWVNLGAGTDNSNLLNTYGEVSVQLEPNGPRQRTGRVFLGSIIGDHVKCAIGTRLMTGTVIGTGAMIASSTTPATTVKRFAWITDAGERRYALPKFIDVLAAVWRRRSLVPSPAYLARIAALHGEGR